MADSAPLNTITAMIGGSQVHCLRLYPLAIPLRKPFEHAAKTREVADPVVVEAELVDGTLGYGETLARPYVTGETPEGVLQTVRKTMPASLVGLRPESFAEALEGIEAFPFYEAAGGVINAARAGVELALLDAYSKHFARPISDAAGWLDLAGLGPPGSIGRVTYSAVISGGNPAKIARKTRMMYWYGLKDFKLKVGYDDDRQRVEAVVGVLGRSLGRTTTLRLDANSAWTADEAIIRLSELPLECIACVEQPLARAHDADLLRLRQSVAVELMPDESLVTMQDAQTLIAGGAVDRFNIRLSKNGGLLPALQLVHLARKNGLRYQLGCMVGETSILSAAGRRFLENAPDVDFAEGSYGRFLLTDDVTEKPVQFGCGGKPVPLSGLGWGIQVDPDKLRRLCACSPIEVRL